MNAFDRHKQLVNNYLTYYGKGARNLFKPDKTKWKKDIDLARENHRFLWEVRKRHPQINSKIHLKLLGRRRRRNKFERPSMGAANCKKVLGQALQRICNL